jgi:hypothetical protein
MNFDNPTWRIFAWFFLAGLGWAIGHGLGVFFIVQVTRAVT